MPDYPETIIRRDLHQPPSLSTELVQAMQSAPDDSDIANFFSLTLISGVNLFTKNQRIRWFKDFFDQEIYVSDALINQFLQTVDGTINLEPYHINRLFLHAFFKPITSWSETFSSNLNEVIQWIQKWDSSDRRKQQLKQTSYPPSLLKQLELLIKLKEMSAREVTTEIKEQRCCYAIEFIYHATRTYIELPSAHYSSLFMTILEADSLDAILDKKITIQDQDKTYLELICEWGSSREFPTEHSNELISHILQLPQRHWACTQDQLAENKVGIFHLFRADSFFRYTPYKDILIFLDSAKIPPSALCVYDSNGMCGLFTLLSYSNKSRFDHLKENDAEILIRLLEIIPYEAWSIVPSKSFNADMNALYLFLTYHLDLLETLVKNNPQAVLNWFDSIPVDSWTKDRNGLNALWFLVSHLNQRALLTLTETNPKQLLCLFQRIDAAAWNIAPPNGNCFNINPLSLFLFNQPKVIKNLIEYNSTEFIKWLISLPTDSWNKAHDDLSALWYFLIDSNYMAFSALTARQPKELLSLFQSINAVAWDIAPTSGKNMNINPLWLFVANHWEGLHRLIEHDSTIFSNWLLSLPPTSWNKAHDGMNALWFLLCSQNQTALSILIEKKPEQILDLFKTINAAAWDIAPTSGKNININPLSLFLSNHPKAIENLIEYNSTEFIEWLISLPPTSWNKAHDGKNALWYLLSDQNQTALSILIEKNPEQTLRLFQTIDPATWDIAPLRGQHINKNALWLLVNKHLAGLAKIIDTNPEAAITWLLRLPPNSWNGASAGVNVLQDLLNRSGNDILLKLTEKRDNAQKMLTLFKKIPLEAWAQKPNNPFEKHLTAFNLLFCNHNETLKKMIESDPESAVDFFEKLSDQTYEPLKLIAIKDVSTSAFYYLDIFSKYDQAIFLRFFKILLKQLPPKSLYLAPSNDDQTHILQHALANSAEDGDSTLLKKIRKIQPIDVFKLLTNLKLEPIFSYSNPALYRDSLLFQLLCADKDTNHLFPETTRRLQAYLFDPQNNSNPNVCAFIKGISQANWNQIYPDWDTQKRPLQNLIQKNFLKLLETHNDAFEQALENHNLPQTMQRSLQQKISDKTAKRSRTAPSPDAPPTKNASLFSPPPKPNKDLPPNAAPPSKKPHQ